MHLPRRRYLRIRRRIRRQLAAAMTPLERLATSNRPDDHQDAEPRYRPGLGERLAGMLSMLVAILIAQAISHACHPRQPATRPAAPAATLDRSAPITPQEIQQRTR